MNDDTFFTNAIDIIRPYQEYVYNAPIFIISF